MDLTDTPEVAGTDEEPPDFDDWVPPEEIVMLQCPEERLLGVVVQLREPTTVSTVADRAPCDPETAHDYLEWFESMGIVRRVDVQPARYERVYDDLRWRHFWRIWSFWS